VRDRELKRLDEQHRRVQTKLEAIYEDRLEGRITKEHYDRKSHDLRTQSLQLLDRMNEMRLKAPAPLQHALDLMDLTSKAADLFLKQSTAEKPLALIGSTPGEKTLGCKRIWIARVFPITTFERGRTLI